MKPAAAALWTEGQALYEAGRYAEAIDRFERGRAIDPRPEFLYAEGQAARKAGDCRKAIELYRRFVVEATTPAQIEAARLQITRCETELAAATPVPAEPPVTPPPAIDATPAEAPRTRTRVPWYRDALGVGLIATSAGALGTGTFFVLRSRRDLADEQGSYGEFETGLDARKRDGVIGLSLLGAGGALAVGAVLRFALWPADVETSATVVATPGGAAAMVQGQF